MALETGVAKKLTYKKETTWGTIAGASGGQRLRRVTSDIDLKKDTYQSNEIRDDYQVSDFRHGMRKVEGSIQGELSAKTYGAFFESLLRRDFTTVTSLTGLSLTIAGTAPGPYTIERAAGDYLTGGVKIGDVIRLSVGTLNAANSNKNFFVTGVTATIITGYPLNGVALVAEGPIASCTVSWPGKRTYVPLTGHTDQSYSIEHFYSTIAQSEVFTGCKIGNAEIQLPTTGMATVNFGVMGKDVTTGTSEYNSSPNASTTTGVLAAVSGYLVFQGSPVAIVTGASISIAGGYSTGGVVGSNSAAAVFPGRVQVSGNLSVYFQDATMRDMFLNETEASVALYLTDGSSAVADFVSFIMPRIKVGGSSKSDGEQGIVQTLPFTALLNSAGGTALATEKTTVIMQDSQM
jgi:hypothetical protein